MLQVGQIFSLPAVPLFRSPAFRAVSLTLAVEQLGPKKKPSRVAAVLRRVGCKRCVGEAPPTVEEEQAAVRMQSAHRGAMQRVVFRQLLTDVRAARTVQRVERGNIARRRVAELVATRRRLMQEENSGQVEEEPRAQLSSAALDEESGGPPKVDDGCKVTAGVAAEGQGSLIAAEPPLMRETEVLLRSTTATLHQRGHEEYSHQTTASKTSVASALGRGVDRRYSGAPALAASDGGDYIEVRGVEVLHIEARRRSSEGADEEERQSTVAPLSLRI